MGIKGLSISDTHIGNNRIAPEIIYRNLKSFLYPQLNSSLNILFIIGDFFHTLLNLNSSAAYYALKIIQEILELSREHGFLIRVLKGTFEHDRDQNKYFALESEKNPNVKVVDSMQVEFIESLGIWVLYVPDDLPYKNAQSEAIKRIKEQNLEKVDIMCLHGYCKHEIPKDVPIEPFNLFDVEFLKDYVKGPILKGHIHIKSIYKNCINNGSFDRWTHGQEEKKGFFLIDYDQIKEEHSYSFIENKDTAIFKTITLDSSNFLDHFKNEVTKILSKVNERTPHPINIRLICSKEIKNKFNPYDFQFEVPIRFSIKLVDSQLIQSNSEEMFLVVNDLPSITRENLAHLISDAIGNKLTLDKIENILKVEEVT